MTCSKTVFYLVGFNSKNSHYPGNSYLDDNMMLNPWQHAVNICWSIFCGKFLKRWVYQTTLTVSWETCKVKKQQIRTRNGTDWLQIGKEVWQISILSLAYLASMQNHIMWNSGLDESQIGIKDLWEKYHQLRWQMIPL